MKTSAERRQRIREKRAAKKRTRLGRAVKKLNEVAKARYYQIKES